MATKSKKAESKIVIVPSYKRVQTAEGKRRSMLRKVKQEKRKAA